MSGLGPSPVAAPEATRLYDPTSIKATFASQWSSYDAARAAGVDLSLPRTRTWRRFRTQPSSPLTGDIFDARAEASMHVPPMVFDSPCCDGHSLAFASSWLPPPSAGTASDFGCSTKYGARPATVSFQVTECQDFARWRGSAEGVDGGRHRSPSTSPAPYWSSPTPRLAMSRSSLPMLSRSASSPLGSRGSSQSRSTAQTFRGATAGGGALSLSRSPVALGTSRGAPLAGGASQAAEAADSRPWKEKLRRFKRIGPRELTVKEELKGLRGEISRMRVSARPFARKQGTSKQRRERRSRRASARKHMSELDQFDSRQAETDLTYKHYLVGLDTRPSSRVASTRPLRGSPVAVPTVNGSGGGLEGLRGKLDSLLSFSDAAPVLHEDEDGCGGGGGRSFLSGTQLRERVVR